MEAFSKNRGHFSDKGHLDVTSRGELSYSARNLATTPGQSGHAIYTLHAVESGHFSIYMTCAIRCGSIDTPKSPLFRGPPCRFQKPCLACPSNRKWIKFRSGARVDSGQGRHTASPWRLAMSVNPCLTSHVAERGGRLLRTSSALSR